MSQSKSDKNTQVKHTSSRLESREPEKVTRVIEMIREGFNYDRIQDEVGISRQTITRIRRDNPDLPPPPPRGMPLEARDPEKFQKVTEALTAQIPARRIAAELGISEHSIQRIKAKYGHQYPCWRTAASSSLRWMVLELSKSIREDLRQGKLAPAGKAFSLATACSNAQLLAGQPTEIKEATTAPVVEDINEALEILESP